MEEIIDIFKPYTFTCRYCFEQFTNLPKLDKHESAHKTLGHETVID